ncbi:MAG TPA: hypothetical protein VF912_08560 [Anaeromyxobacter sp.]
MAGAISLLGPVTGRTEAARPVAWQDPGPFAQPFLQLPFDAPEPVARGVLELSIRTLYSNSIARAQAAGLSVDVSVETAAPMGSVRYGLGRGFEVQLAIPGAIEYPGFLARPIKVVEGLFGSVNPLRAGPTPAAARFRVVRDDTSGIDWSGTDGSAGDPLVGVKRRVRTQNGWAPALSWRAALKVPLTPLPFGSGLFEVGSGLLAGWTFGALSLRLATDVMIPERGPFTAAALRTRPHFTVQVGLARRLSSWLTGMLQASAHTSAIAETGIGVMDGTTTYVLAGVAVEPTRHTSVGFGVVENVLHSSRGADISGVLDFAWHP